MHQALESERTFWAELTRWTLFALAMGLLAGCAGPRMKRLTHQPAEPLESWETIDIYIGRVDAPIQEVAIIESEAYHFVDDSIKQRQLNQLKKKARRLGANAVHDVEILTKRVRGYTIDERAPIPAWQQGRTELYFMRGTAIRKPISEPDHLEQIRPDQGWLAERLTPPEPLDRAAAASPTDRPKGLK